MQTLALDDGLALAYRLDGPEGAPALVFSNSLGTDLGMWDEQAADLGQSFRVVRYDTRGHGRSGVPAAPASIERLGLDLLALLDRLGIARAHLCGLSMGGLTAQWLAIHRPDRVARAVFANTAARIGTAEGWQARIDAVRAGGMAAVSDAVMGRFFSPAFRADHPETVGRYAAALEATDPAGYIACCAALRDADLLPAAGAIRAPALIIAGSLDEAATPAQAEELRAAIPGARLLVLEGAAHLSNLERPASFSAALATFLAE